MLKTRGSRAASRNEPNLFELEAQVWKARAVAKQKWLECVLAEPIDGPRDAARRALWIKGALEAVKRGHAEIKHRAALSDATSEHLSALEMILLSAAERQPALEENSAQPTRTDSPAR
jgi:hypothetical protein